jgi:hypothetical protein
LIENLGLCRKVADNTAKFQADRSRSS